MKTLLCSLLLGGLFCCSTLSHAQSPAFPYNPDVDSNAYIELTDLLYFLDLYGQTWSFSNQSTLGDMMYYGIYQDEGGLSQRDWLSLPIGQEGQLLTVSNGLPEWKDAATILIETFPCLETLCADVGDQIFGCTVIEACNYDVNATDDNGTCDFLSCINFGCTDTLACNYDAIAEYDNGTCIYALFPFDCGGECVNDADEDGICDINEILGCTDEASCNYSALATDSDGTCIYDCYGCTSPSACNFDATASIDNGSCDFISCFGCIDASACNYVSAAIYDDGSCLEFDACGVCGGSGIPEGDCDCDGNAFDECGTCGGSGIPEGDCDCDGNVLDDCGVCNGDNACAPCVQVDGYSVGDIGPAGGVVIYDLGFYEYVDFESSSYDCWRYIEVATEVLAPAIWGCNGSVIYGLTNEIGAGEINTQLILNSGCDEVSPEYPDYAALVASSYNGGGQLDWFLPSPSELLLLTESPDYTGQINGWELGKYWSSNQFLNSTSLGTSIDFSVNLNGELIATPGPSNVMNNMFPILPMRRF